MGNKFYVTCIYSIILILTLVSIVTDTNPLNLPFWEQVRFIAFYYSICVFGIAYIINRFVSKHLPKAMNEILGAIIALLLAIFTIITANEQLNDSGFAARSRNPDYFAYTLSLFILFICIVYIIGTITNRNLFVNKKKILPLVLGTSFYLYFALW